MYHEENGHVFPHGYAFNFMMYYFVVYKFSHFYWQIRYQKSQMLELYQVWIRSEIESMFRSSVAYDFIALEKFISLK